MQQWLEETMYKFQSLGKSFFFFNYFNWIFHTKWNFSMKYHFDLKSWKILQYIFLFSEIIISTVISWLHLIPLKLNQINVWMYIVCIFLTEKNCEVWLIDYLNSPNFGVYDCNILDMLYCLFQTFYSYKMNLFIWTD